MVYPYRGPWCSEITFVPPDFRIEDCVAASGIDIANCSTAGQFPTTAVEREALRVDSGDTVGGMDLAHLRNGLIKRYGLTGTYFGTLDSIQTALGGGWALVILGWLDAVPSRYWMQASGNVYHAMAFNHGDHPTTAWLANPLAPAAHPGWEVPITLALDFARSSTTGRGGVTKGIYCLGLTERDMSGPNVPGGGDVISTVSCGTLVTKGTPTRIYADPSGVPLTSTLPAGTQLTMLGGIEGWRKAVVYLGGQASEAWLRADEVTPTVDPALQAVVLAGKVPIPPPKDCSNEIAAARKKQHEVDVAAVTAAPTS